MPTISHPKPPLCKGRGTASAVEGLCDNRNGADKKQTGALTDARVICERGAAYWPNSLRGKILLKMRMVTQARITPT